MDTFCPETRGTRFARTPDNLSPCTLPANAGDDAGDAGGGCGRT